MKIKAWDLNKELDRAAAGILVLGGMVPGLRVDAGFQGLAEFAGAGLGFAGLTDRCGMAPLLARTPWNQRGGERGTAASCFI